MGCCGVERCGERGGSCEGVVGRGGEREIEAPPFFSRVALRTLRWVAVLLTKGGRQPDIRPDTQGTQLGPVFTKEET